MVTGPRAVWLISLGVPHQSDCLIYLSAPPALTRPQWQPAFGKRAFSVCLASCDTHGLFVTLSWLRSKEHEWIMSRIQPTIFSSWLPCFSSCNCELSTSIARCMSFIICHSMDSVPGSIESFRDCGRCSWSAVVVEVVEALLWGTAASKLGILIPDGLPRRSRPRLLGKIEEKGPSSSHAQHTQHLGHVVFPSSCSSI